MKLKIQSLNDYAIIGDVHSSYDKLKSMIDVLSNKGINKFVFVGDIIDRGPNPNEVVDFIYNLQDKIVLHGNHDNKLIRYYNGNKVTLGKEATITDESLTQENKDKFIQLFKDDYFCCYDPVLKIFISHAAASRPLKILNEIVANYQKEFIYNSYDLFWLIKQSEVNVPKWLALKMLYGITNGDTINGKPIRLPISKGISDDLEGFTYIFGHIHSNTLYPEETKRVICIDHCCGEENGKLCSIIIKNMETIFI
jgi:predicted phosphodiesterase